MNIKSTKHCKCNINYHMVWCTKYRHKVLAGGIGAFLSAILRNRRMHKRYSQRWHSSPTIKECHPERSEWVGVFCKFFYKTCNPNQCDGCKQPSVICPKIPLASPQSDVQKVPRYYFCEIYLPHSVLLRMFNIVKLIRKKYPHYRSAGANDFDVTACISLAEAGADELSRVMKSPFSKTLDKKRIELDFYGYSFTYQKYMKSTVYLMERYIDMTDRNKLNALLLIADTLKDTNPELASEIKDRAKAIETDLRMWEEVYGMSRNPFLD